jgi:hypothetical protein
MEDIPKNIVFIKIQKILGGTLHQFRMNVEAPEFDHFSQIKSDKINRMITITCCFYLEKTIINETMKCNLITINQ